MRSYLVVFEKTKTGYSAYVPDLPGVIATGKTKAITSKNMYEAIQFHIERMQAENLKIPKSATQSEILVFPFK